MLKKHKEKQATGEKKDSDTSVYLDSILKTRAYDLLWLHKKVNKASLMAAIMKHGDMKAIKDLLTKMQ